MPFDPAATDAVILTHAHIDHVGLLPRAVAEGFRRRAFATPATCDLLRWVLTDPAAIQESEAERANRRNERRDLPVHHDFRAVLAQVLRGAQGLAPAQIERLFPGFARDRGLDGLMRA